MSYKGEQIGEQRDITATSQAVAALKHEQVALKARFAEVQLENQVLRRQLYHMSTLLDVALSKLGAMGVSVETPIDIRALREEAVRHAAAEADPKIGFSDSGLSGARKEDADPQGGPPQRKKRFQARALLREHTKAVQCCSFAPGNDTLIATGGLDRRIVIQNFFSGEKHWDIAGHAEAVSDLSWFEGTGNVLSASYDGTVKLWDPRQTEEALLYSHVAGGFVLSATPLDRSSVFACSDSRRRVYIVDVRAHKTVAWWESHSRVNSIAFDSSAGHMLLGHTDGVISVWDVRRVRGGGGGITGSSSVASANVAAPLLAEEPSAHSTVATAVHSQQPTFSSLPDSFPLGSAPHFTPLLRPETDPAGAALATTVEAAGAGAGGRPNNNSNSNNSNSATAPPFPCICQFRNEASHAAISSLAHYHSSDDTKRLVSVSDDNMVRVYRGTLNTASAARNANDLYHLRNVLPGVPVRGFPVRSGFWKGNRDKSQVSSFLDDGEKDGEVAARRLTECDLLIAGGPDNTAVIFDVSEEKTVRVVDRLEGHRDRVTDAAVHHSEGRPIFATCSSDSTVRVWVPAKS